MDAHALTGDRIVATVAAMMTVAALVAGVLALRRPGGRTLSMIAVAAGTIGMLVGALVVVTADGGPGTGNGIVGGYAALVVGLTGTVLGGLALARTRRGTREVPRLRP